VVVVNNALFGLSEYPVKRIDGNRAITDFRTFNAKIYPGGYLFEFGKRNTSQWDNRYWIKTAAPDKEG